ncbi:PleD family two-component system response regulator [Streptomyces sp. NPDC058662]|uniref:response regulator n=1 Tax=Streptomyces sp. NPDC058662 TaxID=3346583 RepID=UPI00366661A4
MSGDTPGKILLVAKDRTLRVLLERLLVGRGFAVVDGGSGADTVALLEGDGAIALLVCERTGPGLDEVALFEEVRRHPSLGRTPILALPPADPECTARAREAGVDDCLAKPFHPTEFLTRVERLARPSAG